MNRCNDGLDILITQSFMNRNGYLPFIEFSLSGQIVTEAAKDRVAVNAQINY